MKAAYIERTGPADTIVYGDLPRPNPTGSQVLVKVRAVALNPVDTYVRSGMVKMDLPFPFIVGCDFAGVVEEVGPDVSLLSPGDRVWGSNQGLLGRQGTFAEYVVVDECWAYPTPDGVSDETVAALSLVGITAHLGLVQRAQLQSGETICVNGGSGGVGSTVIQMARALGARVIATAGSAEKLAACRALGAEHAINYREENVAEALRKVAPAGVNVWWETTREPDFDLAVGALTGRGRLILMAGRDARPPLPVGPFYVKGCAMHGFVMFMEHPDAQRDAAEDINRWLQEGRLTPRIDRVLPLAETAAAHQLQEDATIHHSGLLSGKIVLQP
ncbi:MAG: NADPH:quinone reductase [Verrucomicrobiales bacterium]|nr:NADPH:quinone reductase [Verrucomicrobiales bacterium]MCP5525251.1 NADPH:quinone reductase [Verrucomicrobiales bacterium]